MSKQLLRRILEQSAGGPAGAALRTTLRPVGQLVASLARRRRRAYANGRRHAYRADRPVISVGNLTAGGAGKTPTVLWLAKRLLARDLRVGVVARGYGAADGANDEERMLRARLPGLLYHADAHRPSAVQRAVRDGAEVVLLDDGFQRLDVARDLDIVCLDATAPFGGGRCLPAGLLREPPEALSEAGIVLLTHADQLDEQALGQLETEVRALSPHAAVRRAQHRPALLRALSGEGAQALAAVRGARVALLSGIARPDHFRATMAGLGADVRAEMVHPDHHVYVPADLDRALHRARTAGAGMLVTTEKDAVKLGPLFADASALPVFALCIDLWIDDPDGALDARIDAALAAVHSSTAPPAGD
ncbi:MAG: tetraacyldisaccharide 4'-kinase [Planctomycetota bacterium]